MMLYKIIAKNTTELLEEEWSDLSGAFNSVFNKQFSREHFKDKYFGSSLGYSIHGILFYKEKIVGMFTAIPRLYFLNGQIATIALGCDAFILKEHRKDEYFLKQMADAVTDNLQKAGIHHLISIPNKIAYPYWKLYGGWKDIGKLNYYVLPLRVSGLSVKFGFLDALSFHTLRTIIRCYSSLSPSSKKKNIDKQIHLVRDQKYISQRYTSDYTIREIVNKGTFIYRIYKEDKIITAYLIDCFPLSKAFIALALKQIIKETKHKIDIILFIGKIDDPPFFFMKVPEKSEPRIQPFIGLSLHPDSDKDFFSISAWDVSLANFDNR